MKREVDEAMDERLAGIGRRTAALRPRAGFDDRVMRAVKASGTPGLFDDVLRAARAMVPVAVMDLFARRAAAGAAIVAVLHDPGFAARYCDHALLLFGNSEWLAGPAAEVITAAHLGRLYGHPLRELRSEGRRWFVPC